MSKKRQYRPGSKRWRDSIRYDPTKWPGYGQGCYKCERKNDFAIPCQFKTPVDGVCEGNDLELLEVQNCGNCSEWWVQAQVSGMEIDFSIDTSEQAHRLLRRLLSRIDEAVSVTRLNSSLRDYNATRSGTMMPL